MKGILADAAAVDNATARAIFFNTRDRSAYLYPGSQSTYPLALVGECFSTRPACQRYKQTDEQTAGNQRRMARPAHQMAAAVPVRA